MLLCPVGRREDGRLANRWAELLPIDASVRQCLMELDSPLVRLELVHDLLEEAGLLAPGG